MKEVFLVGAAFIMAIVLSPIVSQGAPSVGAVSGTVADGQSITISGSQFGATGPTVALFDNYESGTNNTNISATTSTVGHWDEIGYGGPPVPQYSTAFAHSGTKSQRVDASQIACDTTYGYNVSKTGLNSAYLYFSWWQYLPAGQPVPGTNCPSPQTPNWKYYWMGHCIGRARNGAQCPRSGPYNDDYLTVLLTNTLPVTDLGGALAGGGCADDTGCSGVNMNGYGLTAFIKGTWHRYEVYAVASSSSSGVFQHWELSANQARRSIISTTGKSTNSGEETWNDLQFPGFLRGDAAQVYYDDIYIATGAGAQARVEIGDNASYSSCKNLSVITPTSWSDGSIGATIRQGSFSNGASAYLFVVDSSGNASAGYPVTIGSGGGAALPAAPRNLRLGAR
jgi:hypothetical protein